MPQPIEVSARKGEFAETSADTRVVGLFDGADAPNDTIAKLVESGEGFDEGTQAVLRGLDNPEFFKPAVLGALAQFLDVAPEFVPAVEAALGAHLQAIVMKDTMVAESVMRTLTGQQLGKASLALRELEAHGLFDIVPDKDDLVAIQRGYNAP